ncbi:hypothetical protein [Ruminococcus sp. NK3A76]|uniref:hypothetical protein n=1 Tax=Ruminococcus sp. NK3A76 TaxID=877411 RepID=UPI000561C381|nr:hypothetical protein [Ruminococcus sp. NK3A76]
MRILLNEIIKAFCRKSTIGVFIALTVLNGVMLYVNENSTDAVYTSKQYKEMYSEISDKPAADVYNELLERKNTLEETESDLVELELTEAVLAEVEAASKYDDYLSGIDERAKKMTAISLFADPDSFSYKNIAKTPDDFAHLKGSTLTVSPSKGVDMATGFLPTDVVAFLMIMTVIVTIVTREKELEQLLLSRTTFKGRASLGAAKLFTCFSAAFVSLALLYSVNFIIAYNTYGFGDVTRQIQSVMSFNASSLKITVTEYFVFFLLTKLLVYCAFAALIYLVTAISDSAVKVYAILAAILAGESVLYYTIQPTSYLCPLKYINLVAFANTRQLYSDYLNLNIFGEPYNYFYIFFISAIVLLIFFSVLSVVSFARRGVIRNHTKRISLHLPEIRHTSLFLHECYKILINGKVLFVMLAFAAFVYASYTPIKERFYSKEEIYLKQYILKYEGELTAEKEQAIELEGEALDEFDTSGDEITSMIKMQDLAEKRSAYESFISHIDYLKQNGGEIVYDTGYKLLTGDESAGSKDTTMALTAMAMLILTLTYVYSIESQTGANILLHTSLKGRGAVFIRKLIIGTAVVTIIYLMTYLPYFYGVLKAYGTREITAPACSMEHLQSFNLSIKAYLILLCVVRYLTLITAMLLIFFISKKAKSFISALLIETAVFILPLVLYLLGIEVFGWIGITPGLIGDI